MDGPQIPVAIVGLSCRLPGGASSSAELWDLLISGTNVWTKTPADRYNEDAFLHPDADVNGTHNHQGGHFINEDIAAFDVDFFGIAPQEAQAMDPQQRLLLETTYEAFENAGITIEAFRGSNTAVYTASFTSDYDRNLYKDPMTLPKYHVTGCGQAILANRLSYIFNLKGPSVTIDTGCSGGLVALHQACQSLRVGECDMAVAAGANLILGPDHMIAMSNLHMLNGQGRSFSYDTRGSGYGRGEGVVSIILKRLDDAIRGGDRILAVVRGSGCNSDGKTVGITRPNAGSQQVLIDRVHQQSQVDPARVCYVEAHGTGTKVGDEAELEAIASAISSKKTSPLYVGSVKSNIGHLEASSGLAGLMKAILVLDRKQIPPNADFHTVKPSLGLEWRNIKVSPMNNFMVLPLNDLRFHSH